MTTTPRTYFFRFVLEGRVLDDEVVRALVAGGCADGFFGRGEGVQIVDFNREAQSFEEAVASALRDVETAVDELHVVRIEPDELVTAAAIAERTGRTRQSVAQLIAGQRGPGHFPAPVTTADGHARIWHWPDVAAWLASWNDADQSVEQRDSHYIAALNGALQARRHLRAYCEHGGASAAAALVERMLSDYPRTTPSVEQHRSYGADRCVWQSAPKPEVTVRHDEAQVLPTPRSTGPFLRLFFIIDTSGSMRTKIDDLNHALFRLQRDLVRDHIARDCVEVTLIEVGSTARLVAGPTLGRDFRVPRLEASGATALGAGIDLALTTLMDPQLTAHPDGYSSRAPWLFVITDGEPTDSWEPTAERVHQLARTGQLHFVGVGTPSANMATLRAICPPDMPPRSMQDGAFDAFFRWITHTVTAGACGSSSWPRLSPNTWERAPEDDD